MNIIVLYVTEEKSKEITRNVPWNEKVELKNRLLSKNTIRCVIEDVNIKRGCAYIKISVSDLNITKIIALDATLSLNSETSFEKFLKYNSISPIEDDIEEKLNGVVIYPEAEIKEGELIINTKSLYKDTNTDRNSYPLFKKLKPLVLGFITGFILVSSIILLSIYSISFLLSIFSLFIPIVIIVNFGTL